MNLTKRQKTIMSVGITVALVLVITWFYQTGHLLPRPAADKQRAADLASLSGLSNDTVLELYDSVGDWDKVRENIFIYKRVLNLAEKDADAYEDVFGILADYQPQDILAVYEFLASKSPDYTVAEELLQEHAKGTDMQAVLAGALQTKAYKVYKAADETQIRQWLAKGYTPQDVIQADTIAQAKDKSIAEVLAAKTKANTWEQVGKKFGHTFDKGETKVAEVKLEGSGGATFTGPDYTTAAEKANAQAAQGKLALEKQICQETGVSEAQMAAYKAQGLNLWDVQNASRLAKQSNTPMDKLLQERKDGKSWETIIKAHTG